ncbi:chemotaxis protein CheA [Natrarchaeobaculum aegyptiacum]|uniref:Chemotaxis protein CheA n=1 Tax=Natrarchaeobaculum aegyptiacum TaxID=745377 RepID=A0A2Z2HS19_9EURY|nr:chemotaxis protein CheA [Natrarchaeobaculum aegyptiacum]ARS88865.1 hypothetical protein B1756_03245 [Natrarchaeobaculum aegyptiacum]
MDDRTEFVQESAERITQLNNDLLAIERDPDDEEAMRRLFRTAHTLKGNAGGAGFDAASDLAHALEDLLEAVRSGRVDVTPALMDVAFDAVDELESMVDEAAETGQIATDPGPTIEAVSEVVERETHSGATTVTGPTSDEIDAVLTGLEPPTAPDFETYLVRLAVTESESGAVTNGVRVLEALIDAFDVLGTDPGRDALEDGTYGGRFDAVFASAVGEEAITAALEPIEVVADFAIEQVSDRFDALAAAADDEDPSADISTEEAADLSVDELLDEFEEFDDLDEKVKEVEGDDDLEVFDEMGEAGSFDDLFEDADVEPEPAVTDDSPADGTASADSHRATGGDDRVKTETGTDTAQTGSTAASADADDEVDDAEAVFAELKEEVEPVGFDELQAELEELEFDEFEEEEIGMDELLAETGDIDDASDAVPAAGAEESVEETTSAADPATADLETDDAFDPAEPEQEQPAADVDEMAVADEPASAADADSDLDPVFDTGVEIEPELSPSDPDPGDETGDDFLENMEAAAGTEPDREEDPDVVDAFDDAADASASASASEDRLEEPDEYVGSDADATDTDDFETPDRWVDDDQRDWTDADADDELADSSADGWADAEADDELADSSADGWADTEADDWSERSDDEWTGSDSVDWADHATGFDSGTGAEDGADPDTDDAPETDDHEATVDVQGDVEVDADDLDDSLESTSVSESEFGLGLDDSAGFEAASDPDSEFGFDDSADSGSTSDPDSEFGFDDSADFETASGPDTEFGFDDSGDDAGFEADDSFDVTDSFEAGTDPGSAFEAGTDPGSEADSESESHPDETSRTIVEEPDIEIPDITVPPETGDRSRDDDEIQSIRVDVEQIDDLLSLVEGLVTTRGRLRHAVETDLDRAALEREVEGLDSLVTDLQGTVMDVRLVPLETVTSRLPRIVRDVARDQDKEVTLELSGMDVELDRAILERLRDPLVHLVRNAVDHGIESPAAREAAGKPIEGQVEVTATRSRDRVTITVADDGHGLEPDALREEAVEANVIEPAAAEALTDEEALELAFHPGLSTAAEVTDVSGRGVGMDVVKRTIEDVDGTIAIDSAPGEGTTIRLTLPVSIAIDDVLFLEVGDLEFGVPTSVVQDVEPIEATETIDGERVLPVEGEAYPVLSLAETFGIGDEAAGEVAAGAGSETATDGGDSSRLEGGESAGRATALETGRSSAPDGMLLRIREDVRPVAIECDHVRDQQEVVVKPYVGFMGDVPGLSGATVRGRGTVVNILDVTTL